MNGSHIIRRQMAGQKRAGKNARAGHQRVLRLETLELRDLLSVTLLSESFKTLQFTTSGPFEGTLNTVDAYQGTAEAAGVLRFESPTRGAGLWIGHGSGQQGTEPFLFSGSGDLRYDAGRLDSQMVVDVTGNQPYALAATGTLSSSNLAAAIIWNTAVESINVAGQWSGSLTTAAEPGLDLVPTTPFLAGNTAGFGFRLAGPLVSTAEASAAVSEVAIYWATGQTPADTLGAPIATTPVYWNHSQAIVWVDQLGTAPDGATHLVVIADPAGRLAESNEANNFIALSLNPGQLHVVPLAEQFKSLSYTAQGDFSGDLGGDAGNTYTGAAQAAGVLDFDGPLHGSGFWMGSGSGVNQGQPFALAGAGDLRYENGVLASQIVCDIDQPYALPATGTLSSADLQAALAWDAQVQGTAVRGSWSGSLVHREQDPVDLVASYGNWVGDNLILQFGALGPVLSAPTPATPVSSLELYWADGETAADIVGEPVATLPIYWNQAGGTYLVSGLRNNPPTHPVLLAIIDRDNTVAENLESNNLLVIPAVPLPPGSLLQTIFVDESFKRLSATTTGPFQGTIAGVQQGYSGTAGAAGLIRFEGPEDGAGFWIGSGAGQQGAESFLFAGRGDLQYRAGAMVSNMVINVSQDQPYALPAQGTLASADLAAQFQWDTSVAGKTIAGSWAGTLVAAGEPATDLVVDSAFLSGGTGQQMGGKAAGVRFHLEGAPVSVASPQQSISTLEVFWASGPNLDDLLQNPLAAVPIHWNEAGATVLVNSLPLAPSTARYLIFVADRSAQLAEADETNNFVAVPLDLAPISNPGIYVPAADHFFLKNSQHGGDADFDFHIAPPAENLIGIAGDWNRDGVDTPGLYDPATSTFYLRNENTEGDAEIVIQYGLGARGWLPLAGDWDGNGSDSLGVYDPDASAFFLKNTLAGGDADVAFLFGVGQQGWLPLAGDWTGAESSRVGLYAPVSSRFFFRYVFDGGPADETFEFGVGGQGWIPLVGDWNGDGIDSPGVYEPATAIFFLNNVHSGGDASTSFSFGIVDPGWRPLAGYWGSTPFPALGAPTTAASPPAAVGAADAANSGTAAAATLAPEAVDQLVAEARNGLSEEDVVGGPGGSGSSLSGALSLGRRRGWRSFSSR